MVLWTHDMGQRRFRRRPPDHRPLCLLVPGLLLLAGLYISTLL